MLYNMYTIGELLRDYLNIFVRMQVEISKDNPCLREWYAINKLMGRFTTHFPQPSFDLGVVETVILQKPFCKLLQFGEWQPDRPNVLMIAPMSGHFSTLLRGTVKEFLPDHNVYITDWIDAATVPLTDGIFGFDNYVSYLMDFIRYFNGDVHLIAVCQPSVPVMVAVSLMSANGDVVPKSMTLMGGPIDTRISPTEVNDFAASKSMDWFKGNLIYNVPDNKIGAGREVYPGFLQLAGFMSMNVERHIKAHRSYYDNLVKGDGDSAAQHEKFYDEYLSVMDLDAHFYLETIEKVFKEHHLPRGEFVSLGQKVDPQAISKTCLLTIEGEKDDITGLGQTFAAHALCPNAPTKKHKVVNGVGHYGIFNGKHFRNEVAPLVKDFIRTSN